MKLINKKTTNLLKAFNFFFRFGGSVVGGRGAAAGCKQAIEQTHRAAGEGCP